VPPRRLARRAGYRPARRRPTRRPQRKRKPIPASLFFTTAAVLLTISAPTIGIPALILVAGSLWFTRPGAKLARLRQRSTRVRIPAGGANYLTLTPTQFEHALANLCQRDGCTNVRVVGGAGDLGADVICTTPDGRRLVIQAKRYAPTTKVSSGDVQKVGGTARQIHGADIAAVVTTSMFTPAALNYCRQVGIRTVDGNALARWASHTGPAPWR
jgi:restriction system protein